jgi:hypothetical protein
MRAAYDALAEIERQWGNAVGANALVRLRDALAQVVIPDERLRDRIAHCSVDHHQALH